MGRPVIHAFHQTDEDGNAAGHKRSTKVMRHNQDMFRATISWKDDCTVTTCAQYSLSWEYDTNRERHTVRRFQGAGLDVYEHGTDINPRLRELTNVVLLPHMGSATLEGRVEMGEKVIINIKTFEDGHRPPDQVVPSML